jgi:DNA repair photolyase
MPILPFINDTEENILGIVRLAKENGARFVYPAFGVTLRNNQREYYYNKLDENVPMLREKYIKQYGDKYSCTSSNAKALYSLFARECDKLGLIYKMADIVKNYKLGYGDRQLSFL